MADYIKMTKKTIFGFAILAVLFLTVQTSISVPKKDVQPTFSDLTVTSSNTHLLLFGMLDNAFTKEMIEGLHAKLASQILLIVNQLPPEFLEGDNADSINQLVQSHIIEKTDTNKISSGGVIVKDLEVVRLEAENMLEYLRTGKEVRDIHVMKHEHSSFSLSIQNVANQLLERLNH